MKYFVLVCIQVLRLHHLRVVSDAHEGQKRARDLRLQVVVSPHVGAGPQLRSSARVIHTPSHLSSSIGDNFRSY